jgi:hypothetical protein
MGRLDPFAKPSANDWCLREGDPTSTSPVLGSADTYAALKARPDEASSPIPPICNTP